jgi:hypothetical protein
MEQNTNAVHCTTQQEFDYVLSKFNPRSLSKAAFNICEKDTYIIYQDEHGSVGCYGNITNLQKPCEILSFQEWCDKFNYEGLLKTSKEFVVPEKWCVRVTEKNSRVLGEWRDDGYLTGSSLGKSESYLYTPMRDKRGYFVSGPRIQDYTEITFEQFERYVFKEEEKFEPDVVTEPTPNRISFYVKYNHQISEDLFIALLEWAKNKTIGLRRDFCPDTYENFKKHGYFLFDNWGFNQNIFDPKTSPCYGVDNNRQGCSDEFSLSEIKALIGYKEPLPDFKPGEWIYVTSFVSGCGGVGPVNKAYQVTDRLPVHGLLERDKHIKVLDKSGISWRIWGEFRKATDAEIKSSINFEPKAKFHEIPKTEQDTKVHPFKVGDRVKIKSGCSDQNYNRNIILTSGNVFGHFNGDVNSVIVIHEIGIHSSSSNLAIIYGLTEKDGIECCFEADALYLAEDSETIPKPTIMPTTMSGLTKAKPHYLIGKSIQALRDHPNGGIVKKGEIGVVTGHNVWRTDTVDISFPSQKDYTVPVCRIEAGDGYKILTPVDLMRDTEMLSMKTKVKEEYDYSDYIPKFKF